MSQFDVYAEQISVLHARIKAALEEGDTLFVEFKRIEDAAKYMQQLIGIIKKNPVVYDEWLVFLKRAGIEEPDWKADYQPWGDE